jgi:hypothetical protein
MAVHAAALAFRADQIRIVQTLPVRLGIARTASDVPAR